jgi:hypothetical protein
MQLFDVVCPLMGVFAVAVKGEDCSPVVNMSQGRGPLHVVNVRDRPLHPSLRRPGLVMTDCRLLFEELS